MPHISWETADAITKENLVEHIDVLKSVQQEYIENDWDDIDSSDFALRGEIIKAMQFLLAHYFGDR